MDARERKDAAWRKAAAATLDEIKASDATTKNFSKMRSATEKDSKICSHDR